MYKNYVKENFVIGDSNNAAINSIDITLNSEETINNPLVIYGKSGTGKTHFAHIAASELRRVGKSVFQMSAMEFIDRLVFALSNQTEDEFRQDLVECDVLIIDDLQFFVGRFGCQDELCLILDNRIANGKLVIFTANETLKEMDWHNRHLASRLLSGLTVKMDLADEAMQIQILSKRLEATTISLSEDLLAEAVRKTKGNGWLIEGVARQIIDMSMQGMDITNETLAQNLQV